MTTTFTVFGHCTAFPNTPGFVRIEAVALDAMTTLALTRDAAMAMYRDLGIALGFDAPTPDSLAVAGAEIAHQLNQELNRAGIGSPAESPIDRLRKLVDRYSARTALLIHISKHLGILEV